MVTISNLEELSLTEGVRIGNTFLK